MVLRVLSIDGGGMRGIYSAAYLHALESAYANRFSKESLDLGAGFHLIVGTSTGAIIGCALARGIGPKEIVQLYRIHGRSIFSQKVSTSWLKLIRQEFTRPHALRKGRLALEAALDDKFGDATLGSVWSDRGIALCIPAVRMLNHHSWVFKTPHDQNSNHRDDNFTLTQVCLATSAAPIYRSLAAIDNPNSDSFDVFVDGGLWANNPVLVALVEALRMSPNSTDPIRIYCLGTCSQVEGEQVAKDDTDWPLKRWKFGGYAAGISISAQQVAFDFMAQYLARSIDRDIEIIRFPAQTPPCSISECLDLDETRDSCLDALVSHAGSDANHTNSLIQQHDPIGLKIDELFRSFA